MELSFLVDALKSLLINYTSNNSQIDESLNDLFSSLESKNLNKEIENYTDFILLASSLFELKAKRMLPQEEEIDWMDEVEVLKDKDLAFARLLQFKAFSEITIMWVIVFYSSFLQSQNRGLLSFKVFFCNANSILCFSSVCGFPNLSQLGECIPQGAPQYIDRVPI